MLTKSSFGRLWVLVQSVFQQFMILYFAFLTNPDSSVQYFQTHTSSLFSQSPITSCTPTTCAVIDNTLSTKTSCTPALGSAQPSLTTETTNLSSVAALAVLSTDTVGQ
jgi:hypothetical protein